MWQDIVMSVVGIIFTIMLIPQLIDLIKKHICMNYLTCVVTGIGCFVIAFIDITLNLIGAAAISVITGIIWILLFILSIKNSKNIQNSNNV